MIKVFKGGYEVAQEYYFNYESYDSDIYDSKTRIITGLLSLKNLTEFQQLEKVKQLEGANLVIIEPAQIGYMVNLLNVREIEFTKTMSNTESIYRIIGSKLMKPKRANNFKVVDLPNAGGHQFRNINVNTLVSVSVDTVVREGFARAIDGTDIRYFWFGDNVKTDLPYEIGKCRVETGHDFYVTQTGGSSHKMQMPSLSGVPFPNYKITFDSPGTGAASIRGKRLEVGYINPNLEKHTRHLSDDKGGLSWGIKRPATKTIDNEPIKISGLATDSATRFTQDTRGNSGWRSPSGTEGSYQVTSNAVYTVSAYIKNNGNTPVDIVFQLGTSQDSEQTVNAKVVNKAITIMPSERFKRYSVELTIPSGNTWGWSYLHTASATTVSDFSLAGFKVEKGNELTDWID